MPWKPTKTLCAKEVICDVSSMPSWSLVVLALPPPISRIVMEEDNEDNGKLKITCFLISLFSFSDAVTVMWKDMFSHVRALACDAVCMQSAASHLADTLAAFTLSALDR